MQSSTNVQSSPTYECDEEDFTPLRCWECNVNFTSKHFLYKHLFHHIKQPYIVLERTQLPPLKITLKSTSDNSFEIISSPTYSNGSESQSSPPNTGNISESTVDHLIANLADEDSNKEAREEGDFHLGEERANSLLNENSDPLSLNEGSQEAHLSPSFTGVEDFISGTGSDPIVETPTTPTSDSFGGAGEISSSPSSNSQSVTDPSILNTNSNGAESNISESNVSDFGSIPGAEPTPPPEPSPEYPKIRIKTTGLLKEPEEGLTITEITDDNPDGDPNFRSFFSDRSSSNNGMWTTPSLEDPLKLPDGDDNILSLFNNNDRAKDLGFHSSESEYISLDRLEDRNRGAMQLYNPQQQNQGTLDTLTGLPMQALAQQVSRLQPNSGNGLHQQNVLINIQQFPSGPPQPSYQPPPMYPHYPPQPMHQPYQYHSNYRPPNPMYYPPQPPGYPPQHMPPPPQPQMPQLGHQPPVSQPMGGGPPQMGQPPMQNNQMPPTSQQQNGPMGGPPSSQQQQIQQQSGGAYRQPMPAPRQAAPRPPVPGNRMPNGPRPPMGQRQPAPRQRAPMARPRAPGAGGMTAVRQVRPRMPNSPNGIRPQNSPVKRTPEQMQQMNAKKKRFDLLTPDKDDDDCQVICMQPKNTDGGLPQIESVQGGTAETAENSIMHLSDSITLSVRNPPPKPVEPKKSDAKAVANILATRGITVTATAKLKEKSDSPQKSPATLSTPLNLNGAVSIIPAAKSNGKSPGESLPTVDLTDDAPSSQLGSSPSKQRPGLPFKCDLCPAQYPNAVGLKNHRQTYHKTNGGICELGIPLINMKTPGIVQKLSSIGVSNYIPVPSAEGTFALPIISTRNPGNIGALGATQMLSLGPVRAIPKPQNNNVNAVTKQLNMQKT